MITIRLTCANRETFALPEGITSREGRKTHVPDETNLMVQVEDESIGRAYERTKSGCCIIACLKSLFYDGYAIFIGSPDARLIYLARKLSVAAGYVRFITIPSSERNEIGKRTPRARACIVFIGFYRGSPRSCV